MKVEVDWAPVPNKPTVSVDGKQHQPANFSHGLSVHRHFIQFAKDGGGGKGLYLI